MALTPKTGGRMPHVDLLKCLAIYFVLMFHCTLYTNLVLPDMPLPALLRYFTRTILSTCVPLFFFVNGYLVLQRPLDLKKHSLRLLKFIGITLFWTVFLLFLLQPYYQQYQSWEEMRPKLWELRDGWNNHLWYMAVLIGIYFLLPLLKAAYDTNRPGFYWFSAVMALLVFGRNTLDLGTTLYNLFFHQEFYLYSTNLPVFTQYNPFGYNAAMGIAYFCVGGVVSTLEDRVLRIPALWRNLVAGVGLLLCCLTFGILGWRFSLYQKWLWDVVWNGYPTVFTLFNVLCLYVLSLSWKKDVLLVRLISSHTLGIYLLHDLLHKLIGPNVGQFDAMRTLPGTMIYSAGLLLLTLLLCLVIKKLPLLKHLI